MSKIGRRARREWRKEKGYALEPIAVMCPYCGGQADPVNGDQLYGHRPDLVGKHFYRCRPCFASVGTHPGTWEPLGTLANGELRRARNLAHEAFDPIWRCDMIEPGAPGESSRRAAYVWLAETMGLSEDACHVAMMTLEQCRQVVAICHAFRTRRAA